MTDATNQPRERHAWSDAEITEYGGCRKSCRQAGIHSLDWGDCARAPESARPEPRVTLLNVRMFDDGMPGIGTTTFTVPELAARVEVALRTVPIRLGPNALGMLERGEEVRLSGGEYASMALTVAIDLAGESK